MDQCLIYGQDIKSTSEGFVRVFLSNFGGRGLMVLELLEEVLCLFV